jgi:hypothetical protein
MRRNPKHELVLDLYAAEPLNAKKIAARANVSPANVHAIVSRARRREDARASARNNPLALIPPNVLRRVKAEAERQQTTPFGLASAVLEMVFLDERLLAALMRPRPKLPKKPAARVEGAD